MYFCITKPDLVLILHSSCRFKPSLIKSSALDFRAHSHVNLSLMLGNPSDLDFKMIWTLPLVRSPIQTYLGAIIPWGDLEDIIPPQWKHHSSLSPSLCQLTFLAGEHLDCLLSELYSTQHIVHIIFWFILFTDWITSINQFNLTKKYYRHFPWIELVLWCRINFLLFFSSFMRVIPIFTNFPNNFR